MRYLPAKSAGVMRWPFGAIRAIGTAHRRALERRLLRRRRPAAGAEQQAKSGDEAAATHGDAFVHDSISLALLSGRDQAAVCCRDDQTDVGRTPGSCSLALLAAALAAPATAQNFSEGYAFFKAVRERDGATVERILANPGSTAINSREPGPATARCTSWCAAATSTWLGLHARPRRPARHRATATARRR